MKLKGLTPLTLIMILGLLVAGSAQAATKVKGTLYSLNPATNSVTLKSSGILTTIKLSAKTKLLRNGVASTFDGLVLGDKMTAVYKTSLYPVKLKASGPTVSMLSGKIITVSPNGVVQIDGRTAKATAQTRILRNGQVASLDSVAGDDDVIAHVEDSSGELEDMETEGPEEAEVYGTVTGVDVAGGTLTFVDANGTSITVTVSASTFIEVGDAAATLSDITVGLVVEVHYDPATFAAYRIEAEDENEDAEIEGTITAVNAGAGTVTIQDLNGNSVTVIADAGTRIERDDEPAFLSDLVVGDAGKAEYDVATFVANEIESEAPETGDDSVN